MGGTVAVTLKEPNGTEHRMYRWTNSLPWFINNVRFVKKNKIHIKNYLKQWNQMKRDWEKHKIDGKYRYPMTSCYAPFPAFLAPAGYGLVVIDMQNNIILSCQNYTTFGHINLAGIAMSLDTEYEENDDPDHIRAKNLFDANRATVMKFVKQRKLLKKKYELIPTNLTYEQMLETIIKYNKNPTRKKYRNFIMGRINIDLSPFTVKYFDRCSNMIKDIKKLGFEITNEEEKLWQEWNKEIEEEL